MNTTIGKILKVSDRNSVRLIKDGKDKVYTILTLMYEYFKDEVYISS